MKYVRCRLQRIEQTKKPVFMREWVAESEASLETVIRDKEGTAWKVVSIDRSTFMERVI